MKTSSLTGRPYTLAGKRVWVAGHRGMLGSALMRRLAAESCQILTVDRSIADLTRQEAVERWMAETRPQAVFLAAARVGGISANARYPAEFLYDNLMIEANIIHAAARTGAGKLLFLGSSCSYPKLAPQPLTEDALLTGPLEPTSEWYAIAKIAGIKLTQAYRRQHGCDFISAIPAGIYGPGDNFDPDTSHVLPALIRKVHEAKLRGDRQMAIWGTGTPRREFLHVDDCADALVHIMKVYSEEAHINVGTGEDVPIIELARLIAAVAGYEGEIVPDPSKPDGTPRKLLNAGKLAALGWRPRTGLKEGVAALYREFVEKSGGQNHGPG
jgi:GDP-L-fucose synthase